MSDHISGENLAAYADGALKGAAKAGTEAHLSRCRECLEALADIVDIRNSRVRIPDEFLRRALQVPDAGRDGSRREGTLPVAPRGTPGGEKVPLRLVFGVAAAFLVAALLGFFFLGRGRLAPPGGEGSRRADSQLAVPAPSRPGSGEKELAKSKSNEAKPDAAPGIAAAPPALKAPGEGAPPGMPGDLEARKKLREEEPAKERLRQSLAEKGAAPAPTAVKEESLDDKAAVEPQQEQVDGVAGGAGKSVLGGIEAGAEKDAADEFKRAERRGKGQALAAQSHPARSASSGDSAARDAVQLLLAVGGRAAAPPVLQPLPRPFVRIAGEAAADLLNPGLLEGWAWFPSGAALELTVATDGRVSAVNPIGEWEAPAAAAARTEAGKLRFTTAAGRVRRAVLTAGEDPPN